MNIGIVLANTPAYSETFFVSKIKGLQKKGFKVTLFVGKHQTDFKLCQVKIQCKLKNHHIFYAIIKAFILCIVRFNVVKKFVYLEKIQNCSIKEIAKKIILNQHILAAKHLDWLHFGFATQAIGKENIAKAIGAKMAVSLRGFDIAIYPLKHQNCYKLLWQNIDKVHVISNDLLALAYKNGMYKSTAYQKITPAIDVNFFKHTIAQNNQTTTKNHQFLTIGRLHWKKGYESILLALQMLKTAKINFTYTIIGYGADEEKLKYMIVDLGLENQVFLKGKLSPKQVVTTLQKSDLYLQYSVQEGFCNAVLEAQAMGVLPIVSDAEGLSENVLNNQTGWVVPKNKPVLLAKKIQEVLSLPKEIKTKIKQFAMDRVKTEFNIEKQQKEFVNFYKN